MSFKYIFGLFFFLREMGECVRKLKEKIVISEENIS